VHLVGFIIRIYPITYLITILTDRANIRFVYKTELIASEKKQAVGSCGHVNEYMGSIKCEEFLDYVRNYHNFKRDSAPCSKLSSPRCC